MGPLKWWQQPLNGGWPFNTGLTVVDLLIVCIFFSRVTEWISGAEEIQEVQDIFPGESSCMFVTTAM